MNTKIKFLFLFLFLLIFFVGFVSANENINENNLIVQNSNVSISSDNDYIEDYSYSNFNDIDSISNEYSNSFSYNVDTKEKTYSYFNDVDSMSVTYSNSISNEHIISSSEYSNYFDNKGNILNDKLNDGDTIKLTGTFNNLNFNISKKLNVIGDNAIINNGTFIIPNSGSGSILSNLIILNNKDNTIGIFINNASNCSIKDNNISSFGVSSFAIAVNPGSTYNNITSNYFKSGGLMYSGLTKSTSPFVMGGANYNYIANNYIECEDANGIYFSYYSSGAFTGGYCNYNELYNNTIKCSMVNPTSWCYGMQLMGSYNKINFNTVIGTYRGISVGSYSNITNNKLINLTGVDYSSGMVTGAEYAIIGGSNTIVTNNNILNSTIQTAGVYVSSNSIVSENNLTISGDGYGIEARGDNISVYNNYISTINGAGVYQAGKYSNLNVKNNIIYSVSGVGVLLQRSSSSKYPSNITITENTITTGNIYAINAASANNSSYIIDNNNIGNSNILTPNGEITSTPVFDYNTTYNVDIDNYHIFFDQNGNLINENIKDGDILIFKGEFNNIQPIISSSIKIVGNGSIFKNSKIIITSDGVWIENITIDNRLSNFTNSWGIYAENVKNIMIINNNISVRDTNAAYAIYLLNVDNGYIKNNILYSNGDYLTYTVLGYGLENSEITDNIIITNGTGVIHGYEASKCIDGNHTVSEIYRTYGILLIYSSNNNVNRNNVTVTSKLNISNAKINDSLSTNSLVGIDAYFDSNNNNFTNNNVVIYGNDNYIYGMGVIGAPTESSTPEYAQYNNLSGNNIRISGYNFGSGLISGYHSSHNYFINNNIEINTTNVDYGITLEYGSNSLIDSNNLSLNSNVNYVIETFNGGLNTLSNNNIIAKGNYIYGIGGYESNNNSIIKNTIEILGNEFGPLYDVNHDDVLTAGNAGIIFVNSYNNSIINNSIFTLKGFAVNLTNSYSNIVTDNYLNGENCYGNMAVIGTNDNTISNNYGVNKTDVIIDLKNSEGKKGSSILIEAIIKDSNGNLLEGVTLSFYRGSIYMGRETSDENGVVKFIYTIPLTIQGDYFNFSANITNNSNYNNASANAKVTFTDKIQSIISADNIELYYKNGTKLEIKLTDLSGNPITNTNVTFNINGRDYTKFIGSNGKTNITINLDPGVYSVILNYNGSNEYYASNKTVNVTVFSTINGNDITKYYGNTTRYYATFLNFNGTPLINRNVTFNIHGVFYTTKTDEYGVASLGINLLPGQYIITAFNPENNQSFSNNITVLNTLNTNNIVKYFRNQTQFTAKLLNNKGEVVEGAIVTFNVHGKLYNITTDTNGIATLDINLGPGNYTITTYNPLTGQSIGNSVEVLPVLTAKDLTKTYGQSASYDIHFVDSQGHSLANQKITFNINGKLYTKTTDTNGNANLTINLLPGNYIITAYTDINGSVTAISNNIRVIK